MSVLVKGMQMPTSCFVCPFCLYGYPDECVVICSRLRRKVGNFDEKLKGIPKDCPLVEVPPHGRLIDADIVCYQLEKQATIDGQPRAIRRARRIVADAPAIIEAEEDSHD